MLAVPQRHGPVLGQGMPEPVANRRPAGRGRVTDMTEDEVPGLRTLALMYYMENAARFQSLVGRMRPMNEEDATLLLVPADIESAQERLEDLQLERVRQYGKRAADEIPLAAFVRKGLYVTPLLKELRRDFWSTAPCKGFRPTY